MQVLLFGFNEPLFLVSNNRRRTMRVAMGTPTSNMRVVIECCSLALAIDQLVLLAGADYEHFRCDCRCVEVRR